MLSLVFLLRLFCYFCSKVSEEFGLNTAASRSARVVAYTSKCSNRLITREGFGRHGGSIALQYDFFFAGRSHIS